MRTAAIPTVITPEQRQVLEGLARGRNTPHKVVVRSRIVLGHGDGMSKLAIGKAVQMSRPTIDLWLGRFRSGSVDALLRDAPRPGGKQRGQYQNPAAQNAHSTMTLNPEGRQRKEGNGRA